MSSPATAGPSSTGWERLYRVKNRDEVRQFVGRYPFLAPLLGEVHQRIQTHFPGSETALRVLADLDTTDDEELVVSITTELDAATAIEKLNRFDEEWWLESLGQAQGRLCINLGFR